MLIVGAGPTGLTMALTLAKKGISFTIIDKRAEPVITSNALAIQPGTMELWEELGIIDEALALGHRIEGITIETPDEELGTVPFGRLKSKYPFLLILPQAKTEELLLKHLSQLSVTVKRNRVLESLKVYKDRVETVCNGETEKFSWVIGCDGANSTVREFAKIPFVGKNLVQHFIMADLHIDWDKPHSWAHALLSSRGPMIFFPFDNKGLGRLVIDVTDDFRFENKTDLHLKDFQEVFKERMGTACVLREPVWISSFRIQGRVAKSYRKGRVFLAGDAAHRHSPFGGQGLNMGVHDGYLLANLLSECINEDHYKKLALYEKRRRPVGEKVVHATSAMTELITSRSKMVQSIRNFMIHRLLRWRVFQDKLAETISQIAGGIR